MNQEPEKVEMEADAIGDILFSFLNWLKTENPSFIRIRDRVGSLIRSERLQTLRVSDSLAFYITQNRDLRTSLIALTKENDRLILALRKYADRSNWKDCDLKDGTSFFSCLFRHEGLKGYITAQEALFTEDAFGRLIPRIRVNNLFIENQELKVQIDRQLKVLLDQNKKMEALKHFLGHTLQCNLNRNKNASSPCVCGLDEALAAAQIKKEAL